MVLIVCCVVELKCDVHWDKFDQIEKCAILKTKNGMEMKVAIYGWSLWYLQCIEKAAFKNITGLGFGILLTSLWYIVEFDENK